MVAWNRLLDLWRKPVSTGTAALLIAVAAAIMAFTLSERADVSLADAHSLEIKDLIQKVRFELAEAELEMRDKQQLALFELQDLEMEINFVVRTGAGVRAEVVGVGSNAEIGNERVQRLRLRWLVNPEQISITVQHPTIESIEDTAADIVVEPDGEPVRGGGQ